MPAFAIYRCLITSFVCVLTFGMVANGAKPQDSTIELLTGRLKQTQAPQKVAAARRLAELGTSASEAVPALIECLKDPAGDVRVVSAFALAKISTDCPASIAALQPLLSDPNEHVRYSAQWSAAQLASQIPVDLTEPSRTQTIMLLENSLKLLNSHEHQPRHRIVLESILATLGSQLTVNPTAKPSSAESHLRDELVIDAADLVVGLYEPNDLISRMQVIRRLRDQQRFPVAIRKNVLKSEATQLDSVLLDYAIALWGASSQADLENLLKDIAIDGVLPDYAYQLVERLEPSEHSTVSQLQCWSQDTRQPLDVRTAAVRAISVSKHDVQGCVDWLASVLVDQELQCYAADALSELAKVAGSSEQQLLNAMSNSRDESFQLSGLRALNLIASDSPAAAQFVIKWLEATPDSSFLIPFLIESSSQFSVESTATTVPIIRQHLKNPNIDARLAAVNALRSMGPEAQIALPELLELLMSPTEIVSIKSAAARIIGAMGPQAISMLLMQFNRTADPVIQEDLLRALSVSGSTSHEAQSICLNFLDNTAVPAPLRATAATTLGSMGRSAQPAVARLLVHCTPDENETLHAMCLLAAAQIDASATKPSAELGLENASTLVQANAAYAMHLCGESRIAFDTLLSMLNESESDFVIKAALLELGETTADWLHDEAENPDRYDNQRLACCELACELANPDWSRLLKLVESPTLGQEIADLLSYFWHPEIACNIGQHMPEVDILLELIQSENTSHPGRARLAFLLSPDGLGAGDDDADWGGLALAQPSAIDAFESANLRPLAAAAPETPAEAPPQSAAKMRDPDSDFAVAKDAAPSTKRNVAPQTAPTDVAPATPSREVEVFYGTNRQREAMSSSMIKIIAAILLVTIGSTIALAYCAINFFSNRRHWLALISVFALAVFGSFGLFAAKQLAEHPLEAKVNYNHRLAKGIEYGKCTVTIPPNHQPGLVESPILLKGELIADPKKHVILAQVKQLSHEDFLSDIKHTQQRKGKNLLVFIHGYNVSFDDAAKRTAQMAFDLDFPGAPIFYSWPSQADWYGYKSDKLQIELSVDHIKNFLEDLAYKSGADTINLVAHSMGNVGLTSALKEISSPTGKPPFNQVVLAAPDVDAEVFKRDIAPNIVSKAKRMTLYTSKTDLALIASRFFNNGARLGDSGPEVVIFPGIETIDATTVDCSLLGHSYYGSNVSVLTDVGHLLRNEPIAGRAYLRPMQIGEASYWTFDPVLISRTQAIMDSTMRK